MAPPASSTSMPVTMTTVVVCPLGYASSPPLRLPNMCLSTCASTIPTSGAIAMTAASRRRPR